MLCWCAVQHSMNRSVNATWHYTPNSRSSNTSTDMNYYYYYYTTTTGSSSSSSSIISSSYRSFVFFYVIFVMLCIICRVTIDKLSLIRCRLRQLNVSIWSDVSNILLPATYTVKCDNNYMVVSILVVVHFQVVSADVNMCVINSDMSVKAGQATQRVA